MIEKKQVLTIIDALKLSDDIDKFEAIVEIVYNKFVDESAYNILNDNEKLIWLINWLIWEFNDGGLHQWLFNSTGNYAHELIEYLGNIKADKTKDILLELINIFPNRLIPKDCIQRRKLLLNWQKDKEDQSRSFFDKLDNQWYFIEEDLIELSIKYIKEHTTID